MISYNFNFFLRGKKTGNVMNVKPNGKTRKNLKVHAKKSKTFFIMNDRGPIQSKYLNKKINSRKNFAVRKMLEKELEGKQKVNGKEVRRGELKRFCTYKLHEVYPFHNGTSHTR